MKIELKNDIDWEYREEVNNFGSFQPDFKFNNQNKTEIDWSAVKTDGNGNVHDMPLLKSKLCFGRIEYRFRHERPDRETSNFNGKEVKSETRCDRCPAPTRHSCMMLIKERVASDPGILAALQNWKVEVDEVMADPFPDHPHKIRSRQFVGNPFSQLWQNVRHAIINRGRFANSNDEAVKEQIEEAKLRVRQKRAMNMRKKREKERAELRAERQPPPKKFVKAAWDECLKRKGQLFAARTVAGTPRQILTLTDAGCEFTAYAWYYTELIEFEGRPVKAGSMGRWLLDNNLASGRTYSNLKDRLRRDIARAEQIEQGVFGDVWQPFDPDADLDF